MKDLRLFPKTSLGKLSINSILLFFVALGLFYLACFSGERGGENFYSNLFLAIPILSAAVFGITSFFVGIIAFLKRKDFSILLFISILIGFLVSYFFLAEIIFPH